MIEITTHTGSEGPHHDPYAFEEFTVERDNSHAVTVHKGLGTWVKVRLGKDERQFVMGDDDQSTIDTVFRSVVGMTEGQARRWKRKAEEARYRAHRAHGGAEWVEGYPGETLYMCGCGHVLDSAFNLSAVE